jgi:hypothetical protein
LTASSSSERDITDDSRITVVPALAGGADDQPGRPTSSTVGRFVLTGVGLGLLIGVTFTMAGVYCGMVDLPSAAEQQRRRSGW